jgi:hypothetical protein
VVVRSLGLPYCLRLAPFFYLTFNESFAVRIHLEGGLAVLEHNPSNSLCGESVATIRALINYLV